MKKRYLPFDTDIEELYPNVQELLMVEGGMYYFAQHQNKYYVLSSYGTMADFFDEEDLDFLECEYEF